MRPVILETAKSALRGTDWSWDYEICHPMLAKTNAPNTLMNIWYENLALNSVNSVLGVSLKKGELGTGVYPISS